MTDNMLPGIFYFVGVSTGQSSIMQIFPRWAKILGIDAEIRGRNAPLHAPAATYRRIVQDICADPMAAGALVTSHKIDLLSACRDLFDSLDPYAEICAEVSCISKRDGRLAGFAKDVISSGLALDHFVPPEHWQESERDVLCLGAGGAAIAISVCLAERSREAAHPRKFVLVDILQERLDSVQGIHQKLDTTMKLDYHLTRSAEENDAMLETLPAGSLVINATGLGKDLPGSPIPAAARFPLDGLVWELNYRGERSFMKQAQAQAKKRNLTIEDGWNYFLHGWGQVIAEVFQITISDLLFARLADAASLDT